MADAGTAPSSRDIVLISVVGFSIIILVHLAATSAVNAYGGFDLAFDLCTMAIIGGFQLYYIRRIVTGWDAMSSGGRWTTGLPAFLVPLLAAFLIPLAIIVALVIVALDVFGGRGSRGSSGWTPRFGNDWGGQEVVYGSDGRPLWVGCDEVIYGSNGLPSWVGDREVRYGSDGRPSSIGNDTVVFGAGSDTPSWIGDREVG